MGDDFESLLDALRVLGDTQAKNPDNLVVREAIGACCATISAMSRAYDATMAKERDE